MIPDRKGARSRRVSSSLTVLLGASLLCLSGVACRAAPGKAPPKEKPGENHQQGQGTMTRDVAVRLARAYLEAHSQGQGMKSPGLNDKNLGGAEIDGQTLYFEYLPERKVLTCHALVYRFHKPPRPGVVEGFQAEQREGTDAGGGQVEYQTENQGVFLSRTYLAAIPDAEFVKDLDRLLKASRIWGKEVLDRVASRVFHPEELKPR